MNCYEKKISLILKKKYRTFKALIKDCSESSNALKVHDLRVSIRRLMSLMLLIEPFYKKKYISKLNKTLKKIIKSLSPQRDTDVALEIINLNIANYIELKEYLEKLLLRRKLQKEKGKKKLDSLKMKKIKTLIESISANLQKKPRLLESKMLLSQKQFYKDELLKCISLLNENDGKLMHGCRIAVKKYRYILEAMSVLEISDYKDEINKLKEIQALLGNVQDYSVLIHDLQVEGDVNLEAFIDFILIENDKIMLKAYEAAVNFKREKVEL